jgi:hypothetical protein
MDLIFTVLPIVVCCRLCATQTLIERFFFRERVNFQCVLGENVAGGAAAPAGTVQLCGRGGQAHGQEEGPRQGPSRR